MGLSGLNCATCLHKDCDGEQGAHGLDSKGNIIKPCPVVGVTDQSRFMIRLYAHYKNGFLPAAGGILDQTQQYLRAMELVESIVSRFEESQNKKLKTANR